MCAKCQFDSTAECRIQLKQQQEKLQLQLQIAVDASWHRCFDASMHSPWVAIASLEMRAPNYICGSWYKCRDATVASRLSTADRPDLRQQTRVDSRQRNKQRDRQGDRETGRQTDSSQFSRRCSSLSNKRHLLIHMLTKCASPPLPTPLSLGQLSKCSACEIFPPSFEVYLCEMQICSTLSACDTFILVCRSRSRSCSCR